LPACTNGADGARDLFKASARILERYDDPPRFSGSYYRRNVDTWKFLDHELFVPLVATLPREECYDTLGDLLRETLSLPNPRRGRSELVTFEALSDFSSAWTFVSHDRNPVSYHADLLAMRHRPPGALATVVPLPDSMAGDYYLFLRSEVSRTSSNKGRKRQQKQFGGPNGTRANLHNSSTRFHCTLNNAPALLWPPEPALQPSFGRDVVARARNAECYTVPEVYWLDLRS